MTTTESDPIRGQFGEKIAVLNRGSVSLPLQALLHRMSTVIEYTYG